MGKNRIQREEELSKKYLIDKDEYGRPAITLKNVAKTEAAIVSDSRYRAPSDREKVGTSSYHLIQLKKYLIDGDRSVGSYHTIIENVVTSIDRENHTHINSDNCGREVITNRIERIDKKQLIEYLKFPKKTNYKLIEIISKPTRPDDSIQGDIKYNGRRNVSFASKFCHYACFYLFEGSKYQDNYSIYDSIVRKALKDHFIEKNDPDRKHLDDYVIYQKKIDEIIRKSGAGISRNGFDHLLWYFYK